MKFFKIKGESGFFNQDSRQWQGFCDSSFFGSYEYADMVLNTISDGGNVFIEEYEAVKNELFGCN